jgi:hypothetical protein
MNDALIYGLIDQRYGRSQKLAAPGSIRGFQRGAQFFDLRPQLTAVGAIYRVPLDILSDPFFG